MAFRVPDILRYEVRHWLERFQAPGGPRNVRRWINDNPGLVLGGVVFSVLLLVVVLWWVHRAAPANTLPQGKMAWFHDTNTGELFQARSRQVGPVPAPSGPGPDGAPAGFRAHVYSYVLDPNEDELFVGFLERPDDASGVRVSPADMKDLHKWSEGRLIKRVKDKQWVPATSPEGQAILQEMLRPNERGQTPIYQMPRP
jgi:hypothetical protein